MSKMSEVMRRAAVAALREIVDGLDGDATPRRSEQAVLSVTDDVARALRATEALREMLHACVANAEACAGEGVDVDAWLISIRVSRVRELLAVTAPKGGA